MKVAFLNLCHCEPDIVARVTNKLTANPDFDMFIHVDAKQEIAPFQNKLKDNSQVTFIQDRKKVYWGGYNAIEATYALLKAALSSERHYDRFVLLQNLDYPIRSNQQIEDFFIAHNDVEFIRGCEIGKTKDWHYARKYKIYNKRDDDFYLNKHSKIIKLIHDGINAVKSIKTIWFNGIIKEKGERYVIHYGAAQWAVTRACAEYFVEFNNTHPKFNNIMKHIQFPDEEYFHTIVHNSKFKIKCVKYDEPVRRWLVNWRNIHYFEFPKEVTVFTEKDYPTIMKQEGMLFCRKVKSGVSDRLMSMIDETTN